MNIKRQFDAWICAWLDMLVGLVSVITFGFYRPWWDFSYRIYLSKKALNKKIKGEEKINAKM